MESLGVDIGFTESYLSQNYTADGLEHEYWTLWAKYLATGGEAHVTGTKYSVRLNIQYIAWDIFLVSSFFIAQYSCDVAQRMLVGIIVQFGSQFSALNVWNLTQYKRIIWDFA